MNQPTFRLLPSLQFTPHFSGGRLWYAVEDPQSGRFIKLGKAEYLIASGLQNGVAPQQIVQVLTEHNFDDAKERTSATITWLAKQGLLITESSDSKEATGQAAAPRPVKPMVPTQTLDPFFIRLPLFSGTLAERLAKPFMWLVSWPAGVALAILLLTAVSFLIAGSQRFWSLNEKLFVEDGRLWWLFAWFVLKCCHEMGHAVAAVSTGSRIRSAGLHFIFLAPVPYVDVTDLWRVTNGRQRVLVSAAGMLAEMAVASVAVLVALSSSNLQLQYMCAALATLGTITTIAFNGNPLMKFDGYYILSDYLSRPNLWTEAQAAANEFVGRLINPFRTRASGTHNASGLHTQGAHIGLTLFGLTTLFYRMLMLVGMAWWLLTVWHGIGALVIAWAVWGWYFRPMWLKRCNMQAAVAAGLVPPEVLQEAANKRRKQRYYAVGLVAVLIVVGMLPSPWSLRAPGIVGYGDPITVRAEAEGVLVSIPVSDRQMIQAGELVARLDNPELRVELADAQLKLQASQEQCNALRARGELALLQAEQAKLDSLVSHVEQLTQRAKGLEVRAPCSGMLLMSLADKIEGRFVKQGTPLCMLVAPDQLEVVASASQRDAAMFARSVNADVTVATTGGSGDLGKLVSVDTRGSDFCEQDPLAARYGGPLAVEFASDESGEARLKYPAPRFVLKATLKGQAPASGQSNLRGQTTAPGQTSWYPGQLVWVHLNSHSQRVWQWIWSNLAP